MLLLYQWLLSCLYRKGFVQKRAGTYQGYPGNRIGYVNAMMDGFDIVEIRGTVGIIDGDIKKHFGCIFCKQE